MTVDSAISNEQVIFVTGGYDHTIKIWQPHTGVCQRTCQHTDSVSFSNFKITCCIIFVLMELYLILLQHVYKDMYYCNMYTT